MSQKQEGIKSQKLRDSANRKGCTLNIAGVCTYTTEDVVLCHFPDESHGMAKKSDDICSGFGCQACHNVLDRRNGSIELSEEDRQFYMRRAQIRTLRVWINEGLVVVK